jgi:hypothetical protein
MKLIKKYWDIIGGAVIGLTISYCARFELTQIQLCYSVIILMLVSMGCLKVVKQTIDKHREEKNRNIIDSMIDGQKPVKALHIAQNPLAEGEKTGIILITIWGGIKKIMKDIKEFWDKFKGYMLTVALAILTVIEMCGGFINSLFGDALTIKGVEILPIITLICTAVVGAISNGFTKEQREKIKALFSKSTTNEIVKAEVKKSIKENSTTLAESNKLLTIQEHDLANYESELENLKNTHQAKKEMNAMIPRLASDEDVALAENAVVNCEAKIADKKRDIENTKARIENITTTINALKTQL